MSASQLLSTLRDVEGVMGSFVVDLVGQLRARDMPPMFSDHVLEEAGPRIARLKDALETQGEVLDSVTLAHGPHSLFLRGGAEVILCVLVQQDVNAPSLRMGTSLVLKRLPGELALQSLAVSTASSVTTLLSQDSGATRLSSPPHDRLSVAPPEPELPPAVDTEPPPATKTKFQRFFRGRPIEDG